MSNCGPAQTKLNAVNMHICDVFATSWEQNFCCRQRTAIFLRHYVLLEIIIVVDMQVSAQVHIAAFV